MVLTLSQVRERYAEDLRVRVALRSPALVRALAETPRERFLGPGPWTFAGGEPGAPPRTTEDDDPRRVYHDVSIAIDPARHLYNGQPSILAAWLDALAIAPGDRVVHIGCGTGYYTALAGAMAGPEGRVWGIEIDEALAGRARDALQPWPWIEVAQGDGLSALPREIDVLIVNAGATDIREEWLDALGARGRLLVPLTVSFPGMPARLGKGLTFAIARDGDRWSARAGGLVVIYSLEGARSDSMNEALASAMRGGRMGSVTRLRRDAHDRGPECWLHGTTTCLSS